MLLRKPSVIDGLHLAAVVRLHIATVADPFRAQRWQTLFNIAIEICVTPRAAGVVNAHRLVHLDLAVHRLGRRERDLAKRHANVGMQFPGSVNFARIETQSAPASLAAARRGFTFYVARPTRSIRLLPFVIFFLT